MKLILLFIGLLLGTGGFSWAVLSIYRMSKYTHLGGDFPISAGIGIAAGIILMSVGLLASTSSHFEKPHELEVTYEFAKISDTNEISYYLDNELETVKLNGNKCNETIIVDSKDEQKVEKWTTTVFGIDYDYCYKFYLTKDTVSGN